MLATAVARRCVIIARQKQPQYPAFHAPLQVRYSSSFGEHAREGRPKGPHYDPDILNERFRHRPLLVLSRALSVSWPLSVWLTAVGLAWLKERYRRRRNLPPSPDFEIGQRKRAARLRDIVTHLGPAFIKVGQALSSRDDVLPPVYTDEFQLLQDQLPPFPNGHLYIEKELRSSLKELFSELSPEPIAAASLGQVYRGRLKSGETVAVKVQRPNLERGIALDLFVLRGIAHLLQKLGIIDARQLDAVQMVDEFGERLYEEMDYLREGANAERFYRLYAHTNEIYVPAIYWHLCTRRVLVMSWVSGVKLTDQVRMRKARVDIGRMLDTGVRCSLRQLLEKGFLHCDPHPGNLLVTREGKLAYLDFGMMAEVKPYQRFGLISATIHLVNQDYDALAKDCIVLGFAQPNAEGRLAAALKRSFEPKLKAQREALNFTDISQRISSVIYEEHLRVPPFFSPIIRSLATLEGIAIRSDASFKVLSRAYPFIASRLLTDPSPELRQPLHDLLFYPDGSLRWSRIEALVEASMTTSRSGSSVHTTEAFEFFFSERAALLREYICAEMANILYSSLTGRESPGHTSLQEWRDRLSRLSNMISARGLYDQSVINEEEADAGASPRGASDWMQDDEVRIQAFLKVARLALRTETLAATASMVVNVAQDLADKLKRRP
mmetsp:Transcript_43958/g.71511  ORF Transcript_43958/g.71511 Transcript_43958/m.71511 type:complete len:666 (-) Transcript_43958:73-2070(-)